MGGGGEGSGVGEVLRRGLWGKEGVKQISDSIELTLKNIGTIGGGLGTREGGDLRKQSSEELDDWIVGYGQFETPEPSPEKPRKNKF